MTQVNATSGTSSVFSTFSASGSPQLALAMLQMELARTNKESALGGIKEIETEQAKTKEIADMMNLARECKQVGIHENTKGIPDGMNEGLRSYLKNNGITVPGGKDIEGNYEKVSAAWDRVIAQLQTKMDTVGANIQTQMVQLQDFMGQYNSYIQGANSAVSQSNQVLSGLARGQ